VTRTDQETLRGRRVVVVNWRDPWHRLAGGSERYAWELARALVDAGASVEFWTARDDGQSAREVRDDVDVRRRGGQYAFYLAVWARVVGERLRRRRLDAVLDMDCGIPSFTPLVVGRRTAVVLFVHHVHQAQFRVAMRRPLSDLGRFLEARFMPVVYRGLPTVAVSESTVAEMREQLGWRGEVRVIHNGTDLPGRAPAGPQSGERVVVLGRVVAHKRVDLVVRAFARVHAQRPGVALDLVGTGPELPGVSALVGELGLGDAVRVHGFLPEEEKSQVLDAARLHVCASDAEGWGQVVLEAAAHGVPTLARDVPGMRDSIRAGSTGWLVDAPAGSDPDHLVDVISEGLSSTLDLLQEPRTRALTTAECRSWAQGFAWSRMREEARDVVAETVSNPSGRVTKLLRARG
jgi:glycosyltransferase involved in cell wall biosynthesis